MAGPRRIYLNLGAVYHDNSCNVKVPSPRLAFLVHFHEAVGNVRRCQAKAGELSSTWPASTDHDEGTRA